MKTANFLKAIQIISSTHSNELIINRVKDSGSVTKVLTSPTIDLKTCNAATVNMLLAENFSVSMNNGLLSVDDYKLKNN